MLSPCLEKPNVNCHTAQQAAQLFPILLTIRKHSPLLARSGVRPPDAACTAHLHCQELHRRLIRSVGVKLRRSSVATRIQAGAVRGKLEGGHSGREHLQLRSPQRLCHAPCAGCSAGYYSAGHMYLYGILPESATVAPREGVLYRWIASRRALQGLYCVPEVVDAFHASAVRTRHNHSMS